jgi:hypothetical protein
MATVALWPSSMETVFLNRADPGRGCSGKRHSVCLKHLPVGTLPVKKGFLKIRRFSGIPNKNNYSAKNAQSKAESIQMVINPD